MRRYQTHSIVRHGRNVSCNGEIKQVAVARGDKTEIRSQCEKCGWNPDFQPVVLEETPAKPKSLHI